MIEKCIPAHPITASHHTTISKNTFATAKRQLSKTQDKKDASTIPKPTATFH
jgi:hypothetical protein